MTNQEYRDLLQLVMEYAEERYENGYATAKGHKEAEEKSDIRAELKWDKMIDKMRSMITDNDPHSEGE